MTRLRAVFLAAGFATRLHPLTLDRAKPLLEVGGVPMLTRLLRQAESVVGDGLVVTNARFRDDFARWHAEAEPAFPLHLVANGAQNHEQRLGAVADLAHALDHQPDDSWPEGYLVLACDNLVDLDLPALVDRFARSGHAQLLVREVPEPVPPGRYSEVLVDGQRVTSFREKPDDPRSNLSAIAVYLLPAELPELLGDYLASDGNPDAPGHFLAWLAGRVPLGASPLTGRWYDIGSHEDLERARSEFDA